MKFGTYEISNKWAILSGVLIVALLFFIYLSWPEKPPDTPQQVLNEALAVAQAPLLQRIEDQKQQAAENDKKLSASQSKYSALVTQYVDLEKRKKDVKTPITNIEIRDRFTALGYVPLAISK